MDVLRGVVDRLIAARSMILTPVTADPATTMHEAPRFPVV